jgi:hypothetical protein
LTSACTTIELRLSSAPRPRPLPLPGASFFPCFLETPGSRVFPLAIALESPLVLFVLSLLPCVDAFEVIDRAAGPLSVFVVFPIALAVIPGTWRFPRLISVSSLSSLLVSASPSCSGVAGASICLRGGIGVKVTLGGRSLSPQPLLAYVCTVSSTNAGLLVV